MNENENTSENPPQPPDKNFTLLSEVTPRPTSWLWPGRIPLGELTLIDGNPATNKSTLTVDLAARVSSGRPMPNCTVGTEGGVLFLTAEDSVSKTLYPRLAAAGANMSRIAVMKELVSLPDDLDLLRKVVAQVAATLIIIDPLSVFLSRSMTSDQAVRQGLAPVQKLAEEANAGVVMIRHLTKGRHHNALYAGSGSIGVIALARSALLIAPDPDEPNRRILAQHKNSLGPQAASLRFEPMDDGHGNVRIEWRGECDCTASDLLQKDGKTQTSAIADAERFLVQKLGDGPMPQQQLLSQATQDGIARRTLERAKENLGVVSKRRGHGPGGAWYWELLYHDQDDAEAGAA